MRTPREAGGTASGHGVLRQAQGRLFDFAASSRNGRRRYAQDDNAVLGARS